MSTTAIQAIVWIVLIGTIAIYYAFYRWLQHRETMKRIEMGWKDEDEDGDNNAT